jgi:hypothetical protein
VRPDDDVTSDYDYAEGLRRARESAQDQYAKEQAEQEAILQEIKFLGLDSTQTPRDYRENNRIWVPRTFPTFTHYCLHWYSPKP